MTDSDELAQALRTGFEAQTAHVTAPEGLGPLARQRAGRHRRHVAGWAGLVVVVLGALGVVLAQAGSERGPVMLAQDVPPPAPHGQQAVSFHGLQVFVPREWPVNATSCGTPRRSTVTFGDEPALSCYVPAAVGITVVDFRDATSLGGRQLVALAKSETNVDGHPARQGSGRVLAGAPLLHVVYVPSQRAVISVASPDDRTGARILRTVSVVPVDAYGCLDHVDSLDPTGQAPVGELLPANASRVTACRYTDGWLTRSGAYSSAQLRVLHELVSRAPARPQTSSGGCQLQGTHGLVLHVDVPETEGQQLGVQPGGCPWRITDGTRSRGLTQRLLDALLEPVGFDGSLGSTLELPYE